MTTDLERAARAVVDDFPFLTMREAMKRAQASGSERVPCFLNREHLEALEALRAALPAEDGAGALRSLLEKAHDAGRERERGRDDADNHGIPPESRRRMDVDRILAEAAPGRVYDATKAHPAPADAGATCCQATRRAALEDAAKACDDEASEWEAQVDAAGKLSGITKHAVESTAVGARRCARRVRTLAQGGGA